MSGAYAVFAVTNYWATMDMKVEIQEGKNLVDAAKETGVQHFILSTLKDVTQRKSTRTPNINISVPDQILTISFFCACSLVTGGKLTKVHHFDAKAEIARYAAASGVPTTYFLPGLYSKLVRP
jgi:hypothetical protein